MNKFNILMIVLVCLILGESCSSINTQVPSSGSRSKYGSKKSNTASLAKLGNSKSKKKKSKSNMVLQKQNILNDTTVIVVNRAVPIDSDLQAQYDSALDEFDKENYSDACEKFNSLNGTVDQNSPLYYETLFYSVECELLNEKYNIAEKTLLDMLDVEKQLPEDILQKVLVRLGHINCIKGKKTTAEKYFTRLKNEFPDSKYLKWADCDVIK